MDRVGRLARQHLDEPPVGGLVRALPDVLGVDLGRVVLAEGGLDASLRLRGVAGLHRVLGDEGHASAGPLGRERSCEPGSSAADHEHVEGHGRRHGRGILPLLC